MAHQNIHYLTLALTYDSLFLVLYAPTLLNLFQFSAYCILSKITKLAFLIAAPLALSLNPILTGIKVSYQVKSPFFFGVLNLNIFDM